MFRFFLKYIPVYSSLRFAYDYLVTTSSQLVICPLKETSFFILFDFIFIFSDWGMLRRSRCVQIFLEIYTGIF